MSTAGIVVLVLSAETRVVSSRSDSVEGLLEAGGKGIRVRVRSFRSTVWVSDDFEEDSFRSNGLLDSKAGVPD